MYRPSPTGWCVSLKEIYPECSQGHSEVCRPFSSPGIHLQWNTWLPVGNVIMGAAWQKTRDTKPPGIYWACQISSTCTGTTHYALVDMCQHVDILFYHLLAHESSKELHASAFQTSKQTIKFGTKKHVLFMALSLRCWSSQSNFTEHAKQTSGM